MAVFETTRPATVGYFFGGRVTALIGKAASAFVSWNDARATRKALTKLSDHELEDIGLSRGDVANILG